MNAAAHWTASYVGRPYVPGGCWLLFRDVQAAHYGRAVDVDTIPDKPRDIIRAFEGGSQRHRWAAVDDRRDGDGILMSLSNQPHHVGTYVVLPKGGARVLHSMAGHGVALHNLGHLELLHLNVVGFYRPLEVAS